MSKSFNKPAFFKRTHYICFPLYSSRSSLQLENLVQKLRDDEKAVGCPPTAFRLPKNHCLPIAKFKCKSQDTFNTALDLFRNFDVDGMLRHAANASNHSTTSANVNVAADDHTGRPTPLSVSLVGLTGNEKLTAEKPLWKVSTTPIDSTNRLQLLSNRILQQFMSAGLQQIILPRNVNDIMRVMLLSSFKKLPGQTTVNKTGQKSRQVMWPTYDFRGLAEKYKDVVMAEDIPLEKLSLCRFSHNSEIQWDKNAVFRDEYLLEVESIPLPQETTLERPLTYELPVAIPKITV